MFATHSNSPNVAIVKDNLCKTGISPYSGQLCDSELSSLQTCYSGSPDTPVTVPTVIDQNQGEFNMRSLIIGLRFLNPSPECKKRVMPFVCLHLFGLCDSGGDYRTTLRETCVELRDNICAAEWNLAAEFLPEVLPVCEDLRDEADECGYGIDYTYTMHAAKLIIIY